MAEGVGGWLKGDRKLPQFVVNDCDVLQEQNRGCQRAIRGRALRGARGVRYLSRTPNGSISTRQCRFVVDTDHTHLLKKVNKLADIALIKWRSEEDQENRLSKGLPFSSRTQNAGVRSLE